MAKTFTLVDPHVYVEKLLRQHGWNEYFRTVAASNSPKVAGVTFSHEIVKHTMLQQKSRILFKYDSLFKRFELTNYTHEFLTSFLIRLYGEDYTKIDSVISDVQTHGFKPKMFMQYLEFSFEKQSEIYYTSAGVEIPEVFSKNIFVKLLALQDINRAFSQVNVARVRVERVHNLIMGSAPIWLPLLSEEARVGNVAYYLQCRLNKDIGNLFVNTEELMEYHKLWRENPDYPYPPEAIKEALSLPYDWFVKLYPVESHSVSA